MEDFLKDIMDEIAELLSDKDFIYLQKQFSRFNIFEVLRIKYSENKHSNILAWLFDSSSDHKLGTMPADKLIKLLANIRFVLNSLADAVGNELSNDELLSFLTNSNEIIESKTYREVCGAEGRVDIVLDLTAKVEPTKIRVVFENKITATETNGDQTYRYYV